MTDLSEMDLSPIRKLSAEARSITEPDVFHKPSSAVVLIRKLANLLDRLTDEGALERARRAISISDGCTVDGDECAMCDSKTYPGCRVTALAALNALLAEDRP